MANQYLDALKGAGQEITNFVNPTPAPTPQPVTSQPTTTVAPTTTQQKTSTGTQDVNKNYIITSAGDVFDKTGNHIDLATFKSLGLNATLIPRGNAPVTAQAPTVPQAPQYIQYAGSPDIFNKATGERITESQAQAAGLFGPNGLVGVQTVATPRPGITSEEQFAQQSGQGLTAQEILGQTGPLPDATDGTVNDGINTPVNPFQQYQDAISAATSEFNAAQTALKESQLMDLAEIKSISLTPGLTQRLAARRISFMNEPQSEYWLQRIALQNEADSAKANVNASMTNLDTAIKLFQIAKPDLVDSQVNSKGELIQIYSNPMNPSQPTIVNLGGGYGDEGKIVSENIVEVNGRKMYYATVKDANAEGGYRYVQKDLGSALKAGSGGTGVLANPSLVTTPDVYRQAVRNVPVGQQEALFAALDTYQQAQGLIQQFNDGVDTGPVSGRLQAGLSKVFGAGADFQKFQSSSAQLAAVYRKMLTGVSSNPSEQEQFAKFLPDTSKQESKNITDLQLIQDTAKRFVNNRLGVNLETIAGGGNTSGDSLKLF